MSAFVPIMISLAALAIVLLRIVLVGTALQPDEGAAAHIWQALLVLGLQGGAALAALAPVFVLRW